MNGQAQGLILFFYLLHSVLCVIVVDETRAPKQILDNFFRIIIVITIHYQAPIKSYKSL